MTTLALKSLANRNGFFVLIEGGAVDWANHGNNLPRMIEEMIDFNNAVQAVLDWVAANDPAWDETLACVTEEQET